MYRAMIYNIQYYKLVKSVYTVTLRNTFTPALTLLKVSPQQQEPFAWFPDLCLEYISPLKGPRLFGHDLFCVLGGRKENRMDILLWPESKDGFIAWRTGLEGQRRCFKVFHRSCEKPKIKKIHFLIKKRIIIVNNQNKVSL